MRHQRVRVAKLAPELFVPAIARTGGCGWTPRETARCLSAVPLSAEEIRSLLYPGVRRRQGEAGAQMVRREHNDSAFRRALSHLAGRAAAVNVTRILDDAAVVE